jgi:molybdopterin/thiamine biosynthesis adenylyltransferase
MSQRLIGRSPDLRRLVEDGFELEVRGGYLLVSHVPHVTGRRHVRYGTLVVDLTLAGEVTTRPADHVARFSGEAPCDAAGQPLSKLINGSQKQDLGNGIVVDHLFSAKPPDGYSDYHQKVTAYVARLGGPAAEIDPTATARTFRPIESADDGSPFRYIDTASTRAGLERYSERLTPMRVAILGLGGTGSYILDLVAKTSVAEIHLYDGDRFLQHNPFRSPGATLAADLRGGPNKAKHWAKVYRRMRHGVHAHPYMVDAGNVGRLRHFDFVFLAIDDGPSRALIMDALTDSGVPFVDVGLGVNDVDDHLSATMRVSAGTSSHPVDRTRVPTQPAGPENDYRHNIQIAELNALNATLAVIKWKKMIGICADLEDEHFCTYTSSLNTIVNADQ